MPAKLAEARGHAGPKMEAPELNSSRSFARPLDAGLIPRAGGSRAAALAEPSRLEEVGARRAPKAALEMEALQEERAGGRLEERPQELSAGVAEERRPAAALSQPGALVEESRARPAAGAPSILPEEVLPGPSRSEARLEVSRSIGAAAGEESREPAARVEHKKKAIEITGPLARRKIVHWEVPQFPSWLAKRGIVEAEVHIRFLVNAAGDVIPDMRVESTSGFGDLDRLAMDSLRSWRFKPLPEGSGDQWGVVTFRFVLE